ncbi:hypothetical protein ACX0G9_26970 [Flavitalea flava]
MKANLSLLLGFASFGTLIGLITGITSSPIAGAIITALFAFAGGKLLIDFISKTSSDQIKIGLVLFGFSVFCAGGILLGIYIKMNSLLTNPDLIAQHTVPTKTNDSTGKDNVTKRPIEMYLRSNESNLIELKFNRGEISADSALHAFINLNHP